MDEFIKKLIERLEEIEEHCLDMHNWQGQSAIVEAKAIVNELAEECKEECNLQSDKILFAYSDLLRRFRQAEESCIWEVSGSIENDIKELEAECEELLGQFKEILYSADSPQKSKSGWIACSERLPVYLDNVLVCTKSGGRTIACIRNSPIEWVDMYATKIDNVIAWQSLPAPYRLKGNETVTNCNALKMETADNEQI